MKISKNYDDINKNIINVFQKYNISTVLSNITITEFIDKIWDKYLKNTSFVIYQKNKNRIFYKVNNEFLEDQDYNIVNKYEIFDLIDYLDFINHEIKTEKRTIISSLFDEFIENELTENITQDFLRDFELAVDYVKNKSSNIIDIWDEESVNKWSNEYEYKYILILINISKNLKIIKEINNYNWELLKQLIDKNSYMYRNSNLIEMLIEQTENINHDNLKYININNPDYLDIYSEIKQLKQHIKDKYIIWENYNKEYEVKNSFLNTIINKRIVSENDKELLDLQQKITKTNDVDEKIDFTKKFVSKFDKKYNKIIENTKLIYNKYKGLNLSDLNEFTFYNYKVQNDKQLKNNGISQTINEDMLNKIKSNINFNLTIDQEKCLKKIIADLGSSKRMNLLIHGDVGCGKTIIAQITALISLFNNKQVLVVVPLRSLRQQHYKDYKSFISKILPNKKIAIDTDLHDYEYYDYDIIFGGKSLYKKSYKGVGLVIFDEPHLLGVKEKENFSLVNSYYDCIWTTATPQPQMQVLSLIGGLDLFELKSLPNGRKPVIKKGFNNNDKSFYEMINIIKNEIKKNNFVFIVVNRKNSNNFNIYDAYDQYHKLFPNIKIEIASSEHNTKQIFKNIEERKIDMLISTNIIKVGINIPHATVIVIYNTGFNGASDLWQLKGRVGRNNKQSYAFIELPENKYLDKDSAIGSVINSNNSFELSKSDLVYRGIETIMGYKQSGSKQGNKKINKEKINAYIEIATMNMETIENEKRNIK